MDCKYNGCHSHADLVEGSEIYCLEHYNVVLDQCNSALCIDESESDSNFCDKHQYIAEAEPMNDGDDAFEEMVN